MKNTLWNIYLYIVALISLIFVLVNAGLLINMGLQTWVFTKADRADYYPAYPVSPDPYLRGAGVDQSRDIAKELSAKPGLTQEQKAKIAQWLADYDTAKQAQGDVKTQRSARRQRDAARSLAQLIVAVPVFLIHWKLIKKERAQA